MERVVDPLEPFRLLRRAARKQVANYHAIWIIAMLFLWYSLRVHLAHWNRGASTNLREFNIPLIALPES